MMKQGHKSSQLKTRDSYPFNNSKIYWYVVTKEGVSMSGNFVSEKDAKDFRDNAFFGYYNECLVKCSSNLKLKSC